MKRCSILLVACLLIAGVAGAQGTFSDATHLLGRVTAARAVAWGDVNNDGWPDLLVGGATNTDTRLFINNHDGSAHFTDATAEYNIPALHIQDVRRLQWLDVNGDGLLDLFVMMDNATQIRLFRQIANHRFQPVPLTIGRTFAATVTSAAWVDMDGDGRLDLVLSCGATIHEAPLVLRQRTNQFIQMRDAPFATGLSAVGAMAFCDYNMDGRLDVFTGYGPTEEPAHFYCNRGSHWDELSKQSSLQAKCGASGAVWFDYDNDQWPDLFVPGMSKPQIQFYRNVRDGQERFLQAVAMPDNLIESAVDGIWADAVDFNMDGWMDLFIVKGNHEGCSLMMNSDGRVWKDKAGLVGIANQGTNIKSAAWADYDGDGSPDLAMVLENGTVRLYRNGIIPQPFLRVNLLGTLTNTPMTNCVAKMSFENCKQMAAVAPLACGMGGDATTLTLVNNAFGNPNVGSLSVRWPNGMTQTYSMTNLAWYTTTNLHMPVAPNPPQEPEAPEVAVASEIIVSPNPFNPTTNLSFTLTNSANVSLTIFNMLGQQVAELAHGPLGAGEHRLTFDASALPSGMYFSRLTVNGVPNVKRMMLAK